MLLALALAVAPRLGAAVVRAQERADRMNYAKGAMMASLTNYQISMQIAQEDLDTAIWALHQVKRRRRHG